MTDTERELLFAMARFMLDGTNRAEVEGAIASAERDRRCPFDGNQIPCVHHNYDSVTRRLVDPRPPLRRSDAR